MAQSLPAASRESLPSVRLTTPHFKTNLPRGTEVFASTFAVYTRWALGLKLATASVRNCLTLGERLRPLSLEKIYMNSGRLRSHKSDMDHCRQWLIRIKNGRLNMFFHITSLDYIAINYLAIVSEPNKVISTNSLLLSLSVPLTQSASRVK